MPRVNVVIWNALESGRGEHMTDRIRSSLDKCIYQQCNEVVAGTGEWYDALSVEDLRAQAEARAF